MYRLAEIEDIDQIAELRILQQKELFKKNYKIDGEKFYNNTKIFLLGNLNKNIYFFVKDLDNKLVSMCGIQLVKYMPLHNEELVERGYVCSVYTREEYRKMGIQTHLLREVIKFSKDKNIGILELKTSNPEAVKVYHKVGFKDNNSMKLEMFL